SEGIPTYFINGRMYTGKKTFEELKPALDEEIANARALVAKGTPRAGVYDALMKDARTVRPAPKRLEFKPEKGPVPVLAGDHAALDVHESGAQGAMMTTLTEPVAKRMVEHYGDRIRLYWHEVVDFDDPRSINAGLAARVAFNLGGNAGFWRIHPILIDNSE